MKRPVLRAAVLAALAQASWVSHANADEPRPTGEPWVLRESSEITNVVDAFDEGDPFDLHLTLGFAHDRKSSIIMRETHVSTDNLSSGGYTADTLNVAKYSESTNRLNTRADIGLFKDIALVARLPIILSHDRKLEDNKGSGNFQEITLIGAPVDPFTGSAEQLFSVPFDSPTRSGIEYLALGLDFGIFNQWRDHSKPNWVFGFEGRFNVSEPMHACTENPKGNQVKCAHPSDANRDGTGGLRLNGFEVEGTNFTGGREPGVSHGTTGLEGHTYLSKRIKYIEPYGGFQVLFEFQNESSDYGQTDLQGALVNHPPFQGSFILGLAVMPWEMYDRHQRITIDFRFTGSYRTEGRDYSELFDALGSSDAGSLRLPNYARYEANTGPTRVDFPSVVDQSSQKVYVTGLTDVQQHGIYRFSTGFIWQAGEYVKFGLGGGLTLTQGHVLTMDQPCNPDFKGDVSEAGPCRFSDAEAIGGSFSVTGIPNPNYRPSINTPGRRFRVGDHMGYDGFVNATVMF